MWNILGIKIPPAIIALVGVILIVVGLAGNKPAVAIVGALVIVLAAGRYLVGRR
jgi:hypothetical protein